MRQGRFRASGAQGKDRPEDGPHGHLHHTFAMLSGQPESHRGVERGQGNRYEKKRLGRIQSEDSVAGPLGGVRRAESQFRPRKRRASYPSIVPRKGGGGRG